MLFRQFLYHQGAINTLYGTVNLIFHILYIAPMFHVLLRLASYRVDLLVSL